jgi:hypothetical protein
MAIGDHTAQAAGRTSPYFAADSVPKAFAEGPPFLGVDMDDAIPQTAFAHAAFA